MKSKSIFKASLSTTTEVLYTVPPNTNTKWLLSFVSNGTGSTVNDIEIKVTHDSETVKVLGSKSLGSGDYILLGDGNFTVLSAGDTITGEAGSSGVGVILTLEETSGLVRIS
jgi:hypothetical protein